MAMGEGIAGWFSLHQVTSEPHFSGNQFQNQHVGD